MGRKRLDKTKQKLTLSIDPDILADLDKLECNKSALFTCAAKKIIDDFKKQQNKIK